MLILLAAAAAAVAAQPPAAVAGCRPRPVHGADTGPADGARREMRQARRQGSRPGRGRGAKLADRQQRRIRGASVPGDRADRAGAVDGRDDHLRKRGQGSADRPESARGWCCGCRQATPRWRATSPAPRPPRAVSIVSLALPGLSKEMQGEVHLDRARGRRPRSTTCRAPRSISTRRPAWCPRDPLGWLLRANLARRMKDMPLAFSSIREATRLSPGDASISYEAGNIAAAAGQMDDAKSAWAQAAKTAPESNAGQGGGRWRCRAVTTVRRSPDPAAPFTPAEAGVASGGEMTSPQEPSATPASAGVDGRGGLYGASVDKRRPSPATSRDLWGGTLHRHGRPLDRADEISPHHDPRVGPRRHHSVLRAAGPARDTAHRQWTRGVFSLIFLAAPGDEDAQVELTHNWDEKGYDGGRNFGHLAYRVDDIYETCQRLMDGGVTINRPPRDGHMAFVRTPDNISVELLQGGDRLEPAEPWASMPNTGSW